MDKVKAAESEVFPTGVGVIPANDVELRSGVSFPHMCVGTTSSCSLLIAEYNKITAYLNHGYAVIFSLLSKTNANIANLLF